MSNFLKRIIDPVSAIFAPQQTLRLSDYKNLNTKIFPSMILSQEIIVHYQAVGVVTTDIMSDVEFTMFEDTTFLQSMLILISTAVLVAGKIVCINTTANSLNYSILASFDYVNFFQISSGSVGSNTTIALPISSLTNGGVFNIIKLQVQSTVAGAPTTANFCMLG